VTLRTLEEESSCAEERIGLAALLDLPGDIRGAMGFRKKIDANVSSRYRWRWWRCRMRLLKPAPLRASTAVIPPSSSASISALTASISGARATGTSARIASATTRSSWAWASTTVSASASAIVTSATVAWRTIQILGPAFVFGVILLGRPFFQPVWQKLQVEFRRRVTHKGWQL